MNLSHLPFFKRFSPELRKALLEVGEVKVYHPGDRIFAIGDPDTDFYMLVEGRIQVFKLSKGGQKRILRTVLPGDTFALVSLFDERPMFVTAEVMGEEAKVFVIPRERFFDLLKLSYELSRFIIDGFVCRLRRYGDAYANMTVYWVDQRFVSYLLNLAELQKSDSVRLPDTLKTIAEHLGTVREVLSRELSKMIKKGWFEKKGSRIVMTNRKAMEERLRI
ncbi:MAG: Crp/Fnr family transcriptional regulator [bacterium]|nr:Crp/Fnr family transcriptional regulator [bacterium]